MRWLLLALFAGTASADPLIGEFDAIAPLREARDLTLGPCQATVMLKGAIADITLTQVIRNPTDHPHSAVYELRVAKHATVIGASLDGQPSTAVATHAPAQTFDTTDPLLVTTGEDLPDGSRIVRAITEPIRSQRETELGLHWTQLADVTDGALRVALPSRGGSSCMVDVRAQPAPGVRIAVAQPRITWTGETAAEAQLITGAQPVAWDQTQPLGDGWIAHALTVIAPAVRADPGPRRVVLVIDVSKSMELVGRGNVRRLVTSVGNALPAGSEVEAVLFDRTATRMWPQWQPPGKLTELDAELAKHPAVNGSDLVSAFALTRTMLAEPGPRGQAMVVVVSDGVLGGVGARELQAALGGDKQTLDVHALIVTPHGMTAPDGEALQQSAVTYGGSYSETFVEDLDLAMTSIASWLRPAWQDLEVPGAMRIAELRGGTGQTRVWIDRDTRPLAFSAHGEDRHGTVSRFAGPVAELVLALGDDQAMRDLLGRRHPWLDGDKHDLAVLPAKGDVAKHRRQMIAAGGPYTRLVEYDDPALGTSAPKQRAGTTAAGGSALDQTIIKRLLNDQLQPRAYSCYARELGRLNSLAGTASFQLDLGRGEVTHAEVTGFADAPEFRACLVEAAYGLGPPPPTPGYNVDDRSLVTYPITFVVHDHKPQVTGGALPAPTNHVDAGDTSTPLGTLVP